MTDPVPAPEPLPPADGAPADAAPLEHANREVVRHAATALLEEQGQHLLFALVEVGRRVVAALLERDDFESGARQLAESNRAAGARSDHHRVGGERRVAERAGIEDLSGAQRKPPAGRPTSGPS